jgi:hypothetical protein
VEVQVTNQQMTVIVGGQSVGAPLVFPGWKCTRALIDAERDTTTFIYYRVTEEEAA